VHRLNKNLNSTKYSICNLGTFLGLSFRKSLSLPIPVSLGNSHNKSLTRVKQRKPPVAWFSPTSQRRIFPMAGMASSLNIGNGLVEIAALTTMIGSVTAASLVLGNKGATGLPWAAVSSFGSLSVIKSCVAAATPGWLRETLGVRTSNVDSAVGLSLNLASKYNDREDLARKNLGDAIAITCQKAGTTFWTG